MRFQIALALIFLGLFSPIDFSAQTTAVSGTKHSNELQTIVDKAVADTLAKSAEENFKSDEIAVTVINLTDPVNPVSASHRGNVPIYPASVVKIFFMAYYFHLVETGKLKPSPEVERGLKDMIVDSSNDATGYILDVITGTSSGAEMPQKKFLKWKKKREAVDRYFESLGYGNINVVQKTFCEDAYGVEQQFRNYKGDNRNMIDTDSAARLMFEIMTGRAGSQSSTEKMKTLLRREWDKPSSNPDSKEFISWALKPGDKLWSKEGWTSKTRHDTAYIETVNGLKLVITVFTENHAAFRNAIPNVAHEVIAGIGGI
ncbi:MAG: serine hydrolase [Pyrinomonadaceae bacterium]